MNKIAILLLVHRNKAQLERLLSRLQHDQIDIFIHLDAKCEFSPSDIHAPNAVFTEKRYDVGLFEFSMVDAQMELIRTARLHGNYSYYLLMSGQCYPVWKIEDIYDFLCAKYPYPFIEIITPGKEPRFRKIFKHSYLLKRFKLESYSLLKKRFPAAVFSVLRYIPGGFVQLVSQCQELFLRSPEHRLQQMGIQPFFGPQWWALPDTVMDHIQNMYQNKKYVKAISDCFSCDETFFQTAIMMEKELAGIVLNEEGRWRSFLWFQIFDGGHPTILTSQEYDRILASEKPFARKFDMGTDTHILDLLDQNNAG